MKLRFLIIILCLMLDFNLKSQIINQSSLDSKLIESTKTPDFQGIATLLELGADVNSNNGEALIYAVKNGYTSIVQLLLENNSKDIKNSIVNTALIESCKWNCKLNDIANNYYGTYKILHYVSQWKRVKIVKLLLNYGANVNAANNYGDTALITAAQYGFSSIVELLLKEGACVNAKDNKGNTPLMNACSRYKDIFNSLESNLDLYIVKLLLDNGAEVNSVNDDGCTALNFSIHSGRKDIANILLSYGANSCLSINSYLGYDRNSILMDASAFGYTDIVKLLTDKGADVNAANKNGSTALMYASSRKHSDIVEILLSNGVNIEARDWEGCTALMWASSWGCLDAVEMLLSNGADIKAKDNKGRTALMWACKRGNQYIFELLSTIESLEDNKNIDLSNINSNILSTYIYRCINCKNIKKLEIISAQLCGIYKYIVDSLIELKSGNIAVEDIILSNHKSKDLFKLEDLNSSRFYNWLTCKLSYIVKSLEVKNYKSNKRLYEKLIHDLSIVYELEESTGLPGSIASSILLDY